MLLKFAKHLHSLQHRSKQDPLSWWRGTSPQISYINDRSKIRLLLGGNQTGKTSASCALAIYHALGICGEHSHPHLLNIGYIALAMFALYSIVKLKSRLNG